MGLPSHTSHLLQSLDVGLFSPLKMALGRALDSNLQKEVSHLQKCERLMGYIEARENTFTESNGLGGWHSAGLIPFNPKEVLRHISSPPSSSTLSQNISGESSILPTQLFENSFITSSPPEASQLSTTTQVLCKRLSEPTSLLSLERNFICRLSRITGQLYAENSILQQENLELKRLNALC